MKRVFLMAAMFVSAMTAIAQDRQFESCPLEVIEQGWKTKTIDHVINGSLGIMLESFNRTWPTGSGEAICHTMEKGLDKEVLDEETALTVIVDIKNGYAEIDDGGTDGAYMSTCYWNRSNGHKLFAVRLGKPTDPFIDFVCFYDYDPAKKALTPEPEILKGYRWGDREPYTQIFCKLPKVGKNVVVEDWGNNGPVKHTFTWDGMKPVYAKTEPLKFDDGLSDHSITVNFKGSNPNIKDFMNAFLSGDNIGESLAGMKESWDMYLNGMKLMPGEEITVDIPNGYMVYKSDLTETAHLTIECCYWNYADKKHKLVALTNDMFDDGQAVTGQYTGIDFYIYDNATHKMKPANVADLGLAFDNPPSTKAVTHSLPRQGKTIRFISHIPSGKIEKRLTWNGSKFIPEN